jgi:hypothetical protein
MANTSVFKASLFDLTEQDRAAIARIRERLELNSNALAVRIALRELARRLDANQPPKDPPTVACPSIPEGQSTTEAAFIGPARP